MLPTTILKSIIMPIHKDDKSFSHECYEKLLLWKGILKDFKNANIDINKMYLLLVYQFH